MSDLSERVRELFEAGEGEDVAGVRFLPLVTLESGARMGLGAEASWVVVSEAGVAVVQSASTAHAFSEAVESKRDEFEASLEAAARERGFDPEAVLKAFPATDVVRAVLSKGSSYMTRLALLWLRLSELRELRAEILAVARSKQLPRPTQELAERLVVPE